MRTLEILVNETTYSSVACVANHIRQTQKKEFCGEKHDKNLLVELGLEELPAYVVTPSENNSVRKWQPSWMINRLSYEGIQTFSTPRRLAVRVLGLADQQTDLTEDFKGPSKNRLGCRWNFSKAAQGFVRGKGLTVDDIEFREVKGGRVRLRDET